MIPVIVLASGFFVYWFHFGWTITTELSWPLFISATLFVLGLLSLLRSLHLKEY